MNSAMQFKTTTLLPLIALAFACFALSPTAQAVTPAPDGGYPNGNTAEGDGALGSLTTGASNTAMGFHALFKNTTGFSNTANGRGALYNNTTGFYNTAAGYEALNENTTGGNNTASGVQALYSNTSGFSNTATGVVALYSDTTGNSNTASGVAALFSNTTGGGNTATGPFALYANSTGSANTADGVEALYNNTTGIHNSASGYRALNQNNIGSFNTASGFGALFSNITGSCNTAIGLNALEFNSTGCNNIALGDSAGINLTKGDNNIDIGDAGIAAEANTIRIGRLGTHTNAYIAGIYKTTVAKGLGVIVDSTGHLGTVGSSERFKDEIKPMDKASESILALEPVTFHYKHELDPDGIPQFGLVAEQVEKVNPDLVARDDQGKVYTVRYDAVNAMLLNEFLKEHRKMQEQEATITQLQKGMETVVARLTEQASQIQKVSDQLELSKPAPQMVDSHQ